MVRPPISGLHLHAFKLVTGRSRQDIDCRISRHGDNQEVTQTLQEVLNEPTRIMARLHHVLHNSESGSTITARERINRLIKQSSVGVPQQRNSKVIAQRPLHCASHQLIEDRQRVAHRPSTRPHHEGKHARVWMNPFFLTQMLQIRLHHVRRHQSERVVMSTRTNRPDHFFGLSRGEHKLHMLRGFFNQLQHRVRALFGDHVGFVDNEHLVAVAHGRKGGALTQIPGIVNAAV